MNLIGNRANIQHKSLILPSVNDKSSPENSKYGESPEIKDPNYQGIFDYSLNK